MLFHLFWLFVLGPIVCMFLLVGLHLLVCYVSDHEAKFEEEFKEARKTQPNLSKDQFRAQKYQASKNKEV